MVKLAGCLVVVILAVVFIVAVSVSNSGRTSSHGVDDVTSALPPSPPTIETREPDHPVVVQSTLSAAELERLTQERKYATEIIATVDSILRAPSFAAKTEIYCRFTVKQTEMLTTPGSVSGEQMEDRYRELLSAQPATQEAELQRQQKLSALQQYISTHRQNLSQCQGLLVGGYQLMPSDLELRGRALKAQQALTEIDRELTPGASSDNLGPVAPLPDSSVSIPDDGQSVASPKTP